MGRATNIKLIEAQSVPDDEFYTPRDMIEAELQYYDPRLFKGKRILCNCDDPDHSEFFRYFADNFGKLKLRRLVGLRYSGSALPFRNDPRKAVTFRAARYQVPIDAANPAFKRVLFADKNGKKRGTGRCFLSGDTGGFSDREGLRQLKDCDIVVTNPPFSRLREFIVLLIKNKKKFLFIGNMNAVGYKEIFPLIQNGSIWLGAAGCKGEFIRPKNKGTSKLGFAVWFTNLRHNRREREFISLKAEYSAKAYPSYDNYPAIEVSRVKDIPVGYEGEMGVPRSFVEKHNPRQFEIVGKMRFPRPGWNRVPELRVRGRPVADRLLIRRSGAGANWVERKDIDRNSIYGNAGGFVYVATKKGEKGYKIGKAENVANRLKRDAFSRQKPKAVMSLEVHNRHQAEKQVHDALALYRTEGAEWFDVSRKELEKVLTIIAGKPVRLWQ